MPIYAYRCEACGFAKDVLQKMSDAQLTVCPTCHQESFKKQVTAAGFQLKGSGWYATDFKSSGSKPDTKTEAKAETKTETKPEAAASSPSTATPPAGGGA